MAALLAVCCTATATATLPTRTSLAGTWAGSYSGAFSGTFRFTWTQSGSKLSGSIHLSNPPGKYGLAGKVGRNGGIQFGVVGAGATYTGTVSGKSMSGSYKSPQGGGSWSAHKLDLRKHP
ncbi:MAG TPA: hypothetical protein VGH82_06090 [Gaiellaceae bacterium]